LRPIDSLAISDAPFKLTHDFEELLGKHLSNDRRRLHFNKSFPIHVKQRHADASRFSIMWIDNPELMERRPCSTVGAVRSRTQRERHPKLFSHRCARRAPEMEKARYSPASNGTNMQTVTTTDGRVRSDELRARARVG
jgi:hypothetical protein